MVLLPVKEAAVNTGRKKLSQTFVINGTESHHIAGLMQLKCMFSKIKAGSMTALLFQKHL